MPFFKPHSGKSKSFVHKSSTLRNEKYTAPGQLGQVDMWGPYPAGRSGCTHLFTLIDAYSQYAVSLPCVNKLGEITKLLKQVLGIFLLTGLGFFLTEILETRLYGDLLVYGTRDLFMIF